MYSTHVEAQPPWWNRCISKEGKYIHQRTITLLPLIGLLMLRFCVAISVSRGYIAREIGDY